MGTIGGPPEDGLTVEKIRGTFTGSFPALKTPALYRAGLFLVAVVLVLLPLVYLGIVALAAYGVYWHAVENVSMFKSTRGGRAGLGILLIYLGPIVAGAILVFFMLKPILARRPPEPKPVSLDPAAEPLVFELVRCLCRAVGAPFPRRIDVDCDVNASASFRRGVLSFFGRDLVLTIGLPLAAGLSLRQLAGVLAHELGHFAQGSGMTVSYVVRSMNAWFGRLVYERDAWDERLVEWSRGIDIRIGFIFYLARFFVWITRRILWLLMMIGHAISTFLMRQMEYDADRYGVHAAGSAAFAETARALPLLVLSREMALGELSDNYKEGRLGDDLPMVVAFQRSSLPPDKAARFVEEQLAGKGSLFDTHPPNGRRIRAATALQAPGLVRLDGSAASLFADFGDLCRRATLDFYRNSLGKALDGVKLVPSTRLLERASSVKQDFEALERYLDGWLDPLADWSLTDEAAIPPPDVAAARAELADVRSRLAEALPPARAAREEWDRTAERLRTLDRLDVLLSAGLRFRPKEHGLAGGTERDVAAARKPAAERREELAAGVDPVRALQARRLELAVRLSRVPEVAARLGEAAPDEEELLLALTALGVLQAARPEVRRLAESFHATAVLFDHLSGNEENEALGSHLRGAALKWRKSLQGLKERLSKAFYPFRHEKGYVDLAAYAVGDVPDPEDFGRIISCAQETVQHVLEVTARILGRLARLAERVEAALEPPPPSVT
jgi:hypothetical protein